MGRARILGAGPSGLSAALALHRRGWQVLVQQGQHLASDGPMVVLNEVALHMLDSLWGYSGDQLLSQLAGAHSIRERLVAWPADEAPQLVPQQALAVPVGELAALMQADLTRMGVHFQVCVPDESYVPTYAGIAQHDWVLLATGRRGPTWGAERLSFGARHALTMRVALRSEAVPERCVLESVPGGWLFLIPCGTGWGTLQAMSTQPFTDANVRLCELLQNSRHIAPLLQAQLSRCVTYAAMPVLQFNAARVGEIAIGDAALALDPISGDGLGSGLRSAVLASATLGAIEDGEPMAACLAHFNQRLELAARSHVELCIQLYQRVTGAEQAHTEVEAMVTGLARMPSKIEAFHYALGIDQSRLPHTERHLT